MKNTWAEGGSGHGSRLCQLDSFTYAVNCIPLSVSAFPSLVYMKTQKLVFRLFNYGQKSVH